jgi:hypothetical protein
VVLLAKLRPVLEYYCSTVWHAATDDAGRARRQLEGVMLVMLRVMKRFLAVFENVHHHDVLRMELGCRI